MSQTLSVEGILKQGHQVASGNATDTPYPAGSIELQAPYFKEKGLDLSDLYMGTLNIDIDPHKFRILEPSHRFEQLKWIEGFPPETFSLCDCTVWYAGRAYFAFVYYPHPETKTQHFHNDQLIEVIAQPISGITYGDKLVLEYDANQLKIE